MLLKKSAVITWKETFPSLDLLVFIPLLATILVFTVLFLWRSHNRIFSFSSRSTLIILLLTLAIGASLRFQMPLRHYLFEDEHLYMHYAQMMNESGIPAQCGFGTFEGDQLTCLLQDGLVGGIQLRSGYTFLLAGMFQLLGENNELAAFSLNLLLGILTILLVFFIGRELWSEYAGLFAAILVAVLPVHVWFSGTTSLDVPGIFFLLAGLLTFLLSARKKNYDLYSFSFLLVAYAAFIRPEIVVVIPFLVTFTLADRNLLSLLWQSWRNTLITIVVSLVIGTNIITSIVNRFTYFSAEAAQGYSMFSWEYFQENFIINARYHLSVRDYFLALILIGALLGTYRLLHRKAWGNVLLFGGMAGTLFLTNTAYLYGGYELERLLTIRLAMGWIILLAILAGIGFAALQRRSKRLVFITLALFLVLLPTYLHTHQSDFIPTMHDFDTVQAWRARVAFQEKNPQCLYINDIPPTDILHGYSSTDYSRFLQAMETHNKAVTDQPCIVFFEGSSCRERARKTCNLILTQYSWEKVPYSHIPTWQFISKTKQEEITLLIPHSSALRSQTQSMFQIINAKLAGLFEK